MMLTPRGRTWDEDLSAYEATFDNDAPLPEKLYGLDLLAVPGEIEEPERRAIFWPLLWMAVLLGIIGGLWLAMVMGGVE